jgi:serine/threonine-protein phosphatase 2A activator
MCDTFVNGFLSFSYLDLCRKLQRTYFLEPAGSKGQWCLDDYQFLPFLWGSSQLTDDGPLEPKQAIDERHYRDLADDYMYLAAVKYINEVKTGPFFEHSSTLYDISNVAHWSKVNQGMIKMYHGEVRVRSFVRCSVHASRRSSRSSTSSPLLNIFSSAV